MDRYKETFETWNRIAVLYQDKFMDLDLYNETYDYICNSISKDNPKILEIGCGPGNIAKYLLAKRPDFDIWGIDVAPNMIELARKNNPNAKFTLMDCRNVSEINSKFDAIICGFCLPYLSHTDSGNLITDCSNLLRENGLIYISFVQGNPNNSGFQVGSSSDRSFFYYHEIESLTLALNESKFEILKIFNLEYKNNLAEFEVHTIITAKKISALDDR
ncbi:MAG: class I SAM-dependent methyltransferase [Saprospiraceae bacterium]|nr:class I SAM-dependent methyltransferase [Saprospiraceae bacterium]